MKKTFYFAAVAALLMASTAAQARGISFNIDGQRIRIAAPRNCMSLSCLSVTDNGSSINMKNMKLRSRKASDDVEVASNAPEVAPPAPPAPAVQAPPAPAPVANTAPPAPPAAAANNAPPAPAPAADTSRERVTGVVSTPPSRATNAVAEQLAQLKKLDSAAASTPATIADAAPPAPPAPPVQQEAAAAATTPLGLWQTQEGNVRVEPCGANICGYGEKNGKKSDELVLINMRPSSDHSTWAGRIHNPNTGKNYDATVAMKGPNQLRVQGCILGGAFCGSTTWKRVS
jgi:uncharacterized protein (DUF2147 family)